MAKDGDDGRNTPTIAEIMAVLDRVGKRFDNIDKLLDRMAAEREADRKADNAAAKKRQEEAEKRQEKRQEEAEKRQEEAEKRQKEAEKRQEEAEKRQKEAEKRQEEAEKRQKEAEKRQKEAEKRQAATEKQVQATSKEVQATGKYVRELGKQIGDVGNQWGSIAEYLIAGDFARILKQRFDITIDHSAPSLKGSYQGKEWEVDAFAANGDIALVGEVKLTLTTDAVDKFVNNNLRNFHRYMPLYRDRKIYGLIAFVKMDRGKEREITEYVHSLGLLLVKAIDNTFQLLSPEGHRLKDYGAAKQ